MTMDLFRYLLKMFVEDQTLLKSLDMDLFKPLLIEAVEHQLLAVERWAIKELLILVESVFILKCSYYFRLPMVFLQLFVMMIEQVFILTFFPHSLIKASIQ